MGLGISMILPDFLGKHCVATLEVGFRPAVAVHDVLTGAEVSRIGLECQVGYMANIAVSRASGTIAAYGEHGVTVVSQYCTSDHLLLDIGRVLSATISTAGEILTTGGGDGVIRSFDVNTFKELTARKAHVFGVTSLAYSPSDHLLASGSCDRVVLIWSMPALCLLRELSQHDTRVYTLLFISDFELATGCASSALRVWETTTGKLINAKHGLGDSFQLALSPSKDMMAIASDDGFIHVVYASTLSPVVTVECGLWTNGLIFLDSRTILANLYSGRVVSIDVPTRCVTTVLKKGANRVGLACIDCL